MNKEILKRYVALIREVPDVIEDLEVREGSKSYTYASMSALLKTIKPLIEKHGFILQQHVDTKDTVTYLINTYLLDAETGEEALGRTMLPIIYSSDIRKFGAEITCARRYSILLLLGIVTTSEDSEEPLTAPKKPVEAPIISEADLEADKKKLTDLINKFDKDHLLSLLKPSQVQSLFEFTEGKKVFTPTMIAACIKNLEAHLAKVGE